MQCFYLSTFTFTLGFLFKSSHDRTIENIVAYVFKTNIVGKHRIRRSSTLLWLYKLLNVEKKSH